MNILTNIDRAIKISELDTEKVKVLQNLLKVEADGIVGAITLKAFNDFKIQHNLSTPDFIGPTTVKVLLKETKSEAVINQASIDLIKEFEGFRALAYICPAGVPTIGYGNTYYDSGQKVKIGDTISKEYAEKLLLVTLQSFADTVRKTVKVPLTDNQFGALVSLCFNIGTGAFQNSTLVKLLNQKKYAESAQQFVRWNKGGGKVLPGLTRRRERERELFLS